jgi:hypothetical protein
MKLKPEQTLYVMGKALQVTAIFTDSEEANRYMETREEGVVAEFGPYILLAHLHDKGISIPREQA